MHDKFLNSLPLRPQLRGADALLLKPLTSELVFTALETPKPASFPETLTPKMTEMIAHFLSTGGITEEWALAILSPNPKQKGSISVEHLRPLRLQSVLFKWVSMTLY